MSFELPQIFVSVLLFAGVFLGVWALFGYPVPSEPATHRRIVAALGLTQRQTVFENPVLAPVMNLGLALARRLGLPGVRARIRGDLDAAGNPNGYSVEEYLAICVVSSGLMALGTLLVVLTLFGTADPVTTPVLALAGFFGPLMALRSAAKARAARIVKQLPYTLDLIAITMGAGSTFTEAVDTVIRDDPNEDLNQELRLVRAEIDFGSARAAALANLAQRIPIESLRSIVGAVNQAESLGTPLSEILKNQSEMLRAARSVRAEKLGASASLRILIPSMLILLAVVLVLFGPMIVQYVQRGGF